MGRVYTYFALLRAMQPYSKIETLSSYPDRNYAKKNFTFEQLIDKNAHVPDNGRSAPLSRTAQAG